MDVEAIKSKLQAKDINFVINRDLPEGQRASYFIAKTSSIELLVELKFKTGMNVCKITVKSGAKHMAEHLKVFIAKLLL